jgi:hypothetical protein
LLARSDVPIHQDLSSYEGRLKAGFSPGDSVRLEGATVLPFRATSGDDASCLNLQRPLTPRVLGVPRALIERGGFAFARHLRLPHSEGNPWWLLEHDLVEAASPTAVVPAFADEASAQWNLKVGLGDEVEVPTPRGGSVRLRLVGLLAGSIFQSELLISERHFLRHFGAETGYRVFLVETAAGEEDAIAAGLREGAGDLSFDVQRTADILAGFARVQNTYLSTFETLGGLGLLLGTLGTVAVLLRSVLERRNELAMMLALGFRPRAIFATILMEHAALLVLGVAIGAVSALIAVAPHLVSAVAAVRWLSLAATLGACVLAGVAACVVAAASAMRGNLLAALRSE